MGAPIRAPYVALLFAAGAYAQCIGPSLGIAPATVANKCPTDAFTLVVASAIDPWGNVAYLTVSTRVHNSTEQFLSQVRRAGPAWGLGMGGGRWRARPTFAPAEPPGPY